MSASQPTAAVVEGTIVFTDLVGYTEYTATRGDHEALAVLAVQERIVGEAVGRDGRVVKDLGDGLMLFFEGPEPAMSPCLRLLERFERATAEDGFPLWVRVGLHWGHPMRRGRDLVGHDVNVAARIAAVAAPGELLCSGAAVGAARPTGLGVRFVELGPVVMKGVPDPVELYRAERVAPITSAAPS